MIIELKKKFWKFQKKLQEAYNDEETYWHQKAGICGIRKEIQILKLIML